MKTYKRFCAVIIALFLAVVLSANIKLIKSSSDTGGMYLIEAKRLTDRIDRDGGFDGDLSDFDYIIKVIPEDECEDIYISNEPYVIIRSGDKLYRAEYRTENNRINTAVILNLGFAACLVLLAVTLFSVKKQVIEPFTRINDVPQELAKGNLAVPIPAEKSKVFGKFTWGVEMLRETIEDSRRKELDMQRDKKLLLLSLSHDIKTPLSSIKLNAKALSRGLYSDPEKQKTAAESINTHADEIEVFLKQLTEAASEDFMNFEVRQGEEFLSAVINKIEARYRPQLELSGTELITEKYDDCLLCCDPDRLAECMQNLMENAIKYGDGKYIRLGFSEEEGCKLLTVSNSGCSIDPEEMPQIFESFRRCSNSDGKTGSGLGLFICRKLMMLMHGDVYAEIQDNEFCVTLVVKKA